MANLHTLPDLEGGGGGGEGLTINQEVALVNLLDYRFQLKGQHFSNASPQ